MDGVASFEGHSYFWGLLSVDNVDFSWEFGKGIEIGLVDLDYIGDGDVFRVVVYLLQVGGFDPEDSFPLGRDHQVLVIISQSQQIDGSF